MSHPFVETKEMTVGYRGVPLIRDIALVFTAVRF